MKTLRTQLNLAMTSCVALLMVLGSPELKAEDNREISLAIAQHATLAPRLVSAFYAASPSARWSEDQRKMLVAEIEHSHTHGLRPDDYHRRIIAEWDDKHGDTALQVIATDAYLSLASHLADGKLQAESLSPRWNPEEASVPLGKILHRALREDKIRASLDQLAPAQATYHQLRQALKRYRESAESTNHWPLLKEGPLLKPGTRSSRVPLLRKRLLPEVKKNSDEQHYDEELVAAVKAFQRVVKLTPDGIVGEDTRRALNLSPQEKVARLRANLERWRWRPPELGERHLLINVANYQLKAVDDEKAIRQYDVVVGLPYRQTPVFSAELNHLVVNPSWTVPHSIAVKDLLPQFQKNPRVIKEKAYQILEQPEPGEDYAEPRELPPDNLDWKQFSKSDFPFMIRQSPGPKNALGRIKFMFPNKHDVYIHDTPSRELFSKTQRDFSSGCIRVEQPFDLAQWVLRNTPEWPMSRLQQALASGSELRINIDPAIPVHITYFTVLGGKGETAHFLADIYQRDSKVTAGLNQRPPKR